jgi:hypothetical protein
MKITNINKPMKRCTMWWGTASVVFKAIQTAKAA